MSMTPDRRAKLEEKYIDAVIEGMDLSDLSRYAADSISDDLMNCSDVEFLENVAVNHEDLLSPSELLESGVNHVTD